MSDDKTLIPIDQKTVTFYEDEITAVVVDDENGRSVYVPLRPVCDFLGVAWSGQYERIQRDAVLSDAVMSVRVTRTDIDPSSKQPRTSDMVSLPLDYFNGWLFGINANRVKESVRERLIRYQRECYRILAEAFTTPTPASDMTALEQVEQIGLAIAQMAREQIIFDSRLTTTEQRLDKAAVVVGDINKRLHSLEERVAPGEPVTNEQAAQISDTVKAIAMVLGKQSGRNEFAGVYTELYRRFGITSYKLLPATKFGDCMRWLGDWYEELTGETPF